MNLHHMHNKTDKAGDLPAHYRICGNTTITPPHHTLGHVSHNGPAKRPCLYSEPWPLFLHDKSYRTPSHHLAACICIYYIPWDGQLLLACMHRGDVQSADFNAVPMRCSAQIFTNMHQLTYGHQVITTPPATLQAGEPCSLLAPKPWANHMAPHSLAYNRFTTTTTTTKPCAYWSCTVIITISASLAI